MENSDLLSLIHLFLEEGANLSSILVAILVLMLLKTSERVRKVEFLKGSFMPEFYELYRNVSNIFGNTNEIKETIKELENIRDEIRKINRKVGSINDTINDDTNDY
jgi:hypothetical protein